MKNGPGRVDTGLAAEPAGSDSLIAGIADWMEETWRNRSREQARAEVERCLQGLDPRTLRALAHRLGLTGAAAGPGRLGDDEC